MKKVQEAMVGILLTLGYRLIVRPIYMLYVLLLLVEDGLHLLRSKVHFGLKAKNS